MTYQNLPTFGIRGGRPSNRSHHRSRARTTTLFALIGAVIGVVSLTTVSSAQPASDRRGGVIFVEPTTDENFFRIGLSWSFAVSPASAPRNLSTALDLYVNGTRIQSTLVDVIVGSGSTFCGSPPCNGSCGSALINGQNAAMLCYVDGPPPSDDCDCGQWITTDVDDSCYLEPGDEIMVLLRPAPGSVPEENGGNDRSE